MKLTLTLLTALLLSPLAAHAQQTPSTATTVRDHLWLFGYPPDQNLPMSAARLTRKP